MKRGIIIRIFEILKKGMPPNPHPDSIPAPMWDIIYVAEQRVKYIVAPNPAAAGEEVRPSNLFLLHYVLLFVQTN